MSALDELDAIWRVLPAETRAVLTAAAEADTAIGPDGLTDEEREMLELAVHEAGHAVAAVALGAQIERGYVLWHEEDDGVRGRVLVASMPPGDVKPQIAYAGPWAQARVQYGTSWPTPQQVDSVMERYGRDDRPMCRSGEDEGREVIQLVDHCWPAVIEVARELMRNGEVQHKHVVAALGLSVDDYTRHPFELANLRAGLTQPAA